MLRKLAAFSKFPRPFVKPYILGTSALLVLVLSPSQWLLDAYSFSLVRSVSWLSLPLHATPSLNVGHLLARTLRSIEPLFSLLSKPSPSRHWLERYISHLLDFIFFKVYFVPLANNLPFLYCPVRTISRLPVIRIQYFQSLSPRRLTRFPQPT